MGTPAETQGAILVQSRRHLIRKGLGIVYLFVALLPGIWVLTHPMPVAWLRPVCKDTWAIVVACVMAGAPLAFIPPHRGTRLVIVSDSANAGHFPGMVLQHRLASCGQSMSNLGHLSVQRRSFVLQRACELLNGQQISVMPGARHPYPVLLAVLLKIFMTRLPAGYVSSLRLLWLLPRGRLSR